MASSLSSSLLTTLWVDGVVVGDDELGQSNSLCGVDCCSAFLGVKDGNMDVGVLSPRRDPRLGPRVRKSACVSRNHR